MLYLGINQHVRQLTISLRDERGDVLQARQVSTRPEKIQGFLERFCTTGLAGKGHVIRDKKIPYDGGAVEVQEWLYR